MKMRTICTTVFNLDELNPDARKKAIENFSISMEYPGFSDLDDTLQSFQELFGVTVREYEVSYCSRPYVNYYINNYTPEFDSPIRFRTWIINNYYEGLFHGKYYGKLTGEPGNYKNVKRYSKIKKEEYCPTGYYLDSAITEPIRQFLKNPYHTTWHELIGECLMNCLKKVEKDIDYCYSTEGITETIEIYGIEFYENGERY